jgi:Bacteriocin-protection, YdeI or OmpD-Associated
MGGTPMISLSAEHRTASGLAGGDEVEVDLELGTAPREVEIPPDLAAALDAEPAARRTFDALSYSNRSWHVLQVTGAKTDETRQRRIAKSVEAPEGRSPAMSKLAVVEYVSPDGVIPSRGVPDPVRCRLDPAPRC